MDRKFSSLPPDLTPNLPGLSILRFSALLGEGDGELDQDARDAMTSQVAGGALESVAPSDIWPELVRGLMARVPSRMILALRACGALAAVLPEVAALFGVPQIADDPPLVDLGDHLLRALNEAARREAPLSVRLALLVMNVGKADSPPEHLPVHYRHIDRGGPRIEAICERFNAPRDCRELALQALAECERVHRTSEARAGPVALMLERLGAFDAPDSFALLMEVCACDYCAYGERAGAAYPKAKLLEAAFKACAGVEAPTGGAEAAEAARTARAAAIAKAFRSERWSGE